MSDVVTAYLSTPPIARTAATVVFLASVGVYTGMIASSPFYFHYQLLLQFPPAIHRLFTSFLITRPQMAVVFEPYFSMYAYNAIQDSRLKLTVRL
jgi:Derlin-2/3